MARAHPSPFFWTGKTEKMEQLLVFPNFSFSANFNTNKERSHGKANSNTDVAEGKLEHARIIQTGQWQWVTKLVIMYAKCGRLLAARKLFFDQMPQHQHNVVSWTAMIAAHARCGDSPEALRLFCQMKKQNGIWPNQFTFASVVSACANLATLENGRELHGQLLRSGFHSNVFVGNALLDMYSKCGHIEDARQIFEEIPQRDVVSWNAMTAGYAQNGRLHEALELFRKMPERERNVVTWNGLIAGLAQNGFINDAFKLFEEMPVRNVISWTAMIAGCAKNGLVDRALELFQKMSERNAISWTAMIAGLAQNGHVTESLKLFRKMPERDVVSWNAMISGLARNGDCDEALKLFRQMQTSGGMQPNAGSYTIVLAACADIASLSHGEEVHEDIIRNRFLLSDICIGNALVDMYAKCGNIEDASKVFDEMPRRNVISWTTVIVGHALHGCGEQVIRLFEQMEHAGITPNPITFVGVLSACCHAGLLDYGWRYFNGMREIYRLSPTMEHYCCMVHLLGRAGHLEDAWEFIQNMPMKPDASVWRSLLSACRIHANVEIGERVAEYLLQWDSQNVAAYLLLSNIYAAANGKWDRVSQLRNMMKERRVKWKPGCSWIEVNKLVYAFVAGESTLTIIPDTHTYTQ